MLRSPLLIKKRVPLVLVTALVSFGLLATTLTRSLAATSVLAHASELLRQQIEAWKTPPVAVESTPPVETPEAAAVSPATPSPQPTSETMTGAQPASDVTTLAPQPGKPVKAPRPKLKLTASEDTIRAASMLARFYEERDYRLAWSSEAGPQPLAEDLLETIQAEAAREGLQVAAYRLPKLQKLIQKVRDQLASPQEFDPRLLTDLDLLLTDLFLTYSAHLSVGKTNLDAMDAQWFETRQKTDLPQALHNALSSGQLQKTLQTLSPHYDGYTRLREALARYRDLAANGGWPRIPSGFDLRSGDFDERIPTLRARLQITGDLEKQESVNVASSEGRPRKSEKTHKKKFSGNNEYDAPLVQAVKSFQRRHGLASDGVIGGGTLAALNVSVETRIQQITMNMERWRTLPQDLGTRRIEVNIPNFTLDVVDNEQSALHMKVVVGKMLEKRTTPTFTAKMTHVVLNPYWHVPKSIAEGELFPLSRKNPRYFSDHNFIVRRVEVGEKQIPAPNTSDGSTVSTKVYKYLLKQAPGPKNALGRVKFIFPNPHGVYLHDTPSKDLFNRTVRTYSHGCIRVEKPVDLAEYLLHEHTKWTRESILSTMSQQKEKTVWLPEAVPVYIQYWTAWVDTDGTVQFRNDIYGYDEVPGAKLPVASPRNPRPDPLPVAQPPLQEAQPTPSEAQPLPRSESLSETPTETQPASPPETQQTL